MIRSLSVWVILFSVHAHSAAPKRWILQGNIEILDRKVQAKGIGVVRKLRMQDGIVAVGSTEQIESLKAEMTDLQVEEDLIQSIDGSEVSKASGGKTPPQQTQSVPWGIQKIRARETVATGEGVVVCVSDTGIDLTHPDLAGNIIDQFNTIRPDRSADDDNGHGSHVAGTISAINNLIGVVGVAPKAKLIAARGLNRNGTGYSSDLAETIDGCRVRGAHIINMSWGSSTPNAFIHDAIIRAFDAGIILIGAAGNNGGAVIFPAAFSEVVAVSAVDSNDLIASFSSRGPEIENSAPGVSVYSTYKDGQYATLSGTSMAAPHVSGVAALMLSVYPNRTRTELYGVDIGLPLESQGIRGRIDAVLATQ